MVADFEPTTNTRSLSHGPDAYVIDAGGYDASGAQTSHWIVGGFHGWGRRGLADWTSVRALLSVGRATVHGHRARSGPTVGVGSRALRREMLRIAAAMRLYRP